MENTIKKAKMIMQRLVNDSSLPLHLDVSRDIRGNDESSLQKVTRIIEEKFQEYANDEAAIIKCMMELFLNKALENKEIDITEKVIMTLPLLDDSVFHQAKDYIDQLLSVSKEKSDDKIKIILDKSGYGFVLTPFGCDELIRRKKEKSSCQERNFTWTESFINKNLDKIWFRCDEDLVDTASEYGLDAILNQFAIHDIDLPGIDILKDKRVRIDAYENYGFEEMLHIELA